jgi:hypothetical protein
LWERRGRGGGGRGYHPAGSTRSGQTSRRHRPSRWQASKRGAGARRPAGRLNGMHSPPRGGRGARSGHRRREGVGARILCVDCDGKDE